MTANRRIYSKYHCDMLQIAVCDGAGAVYSVLGTDGVREVRLWVVGLVGGLAGMVLFLNNVLAALFDRYYTVAVGGATTFGNELMG